MGQVMEITTNAGDMDYPAAINRLEWAVWHAQRLGLSVPPHIEAGLMLLTGKAHLTTYSTMGGQPFVLCVGRLETEQDFEDELELIRLSYEVMKRRRKRATEERPTIIGFDWPPNA